MLEFSICEFRADFIDEPFVGFNSIFRLRKVKLSSICLAPIYGIPVGADLEYADETTLRRAIEGRQSI